MRGGQYKRLSPAAGLALKEDFGEIIPGSIDAILDFMVFARQTVKEKISDRNKQKSVLRNITRFAFELDRPLSDEELEKCILGSFND
ncbi:MAG: hypothetical protein K2J73_05735 [Oscillospiraceae bacterium]|nr:hypothetical protein [Oscillospiraceae bacterium]